VTYAAWRQYSGIIEQESRSVREILKILAVGFRDKSYDNLLLYLFLILFVLVAVDKSRTFTPLLRQCVPLFLDFI